MKIAVVDLISVDGGGFHITNNFYNYVKEGNCQQYDWIFIVSKQDFTSNQYVAIKKIPKSVRGYWNRAKVELFDVNRIIRENNVDLVIAMSNMCILGCGIRQLVYLQQSIPFQKEKRFSFLVPAERKYAFRQHIQGRLILASIRKAVCVLVQTRWMEAAVKQRIKKTPIVRIGYPEENINDRPCHVAKDIQSNFFYPCGPELYKNLPTVVRAVRRLREKGYAFKFFLTITEEEFRFLNEEIKENNDFICLGRITHDKVLELYAQTTLVFASYIETVGLPLVEAKNARTWIIASDCAFSHEVLDLYPNKSFFPYEDDMELSKQMERVLLHDVAIKKLQLEEKQDMNCWDVLCDYIGKMDPKIDK